MDRALLISLLQSLHPIGVLAFPEDTPPPNDFSEKYRYHPLLQACYAPDALFETVRTLPQHMLWEVQDAVGIRILVFRLDGSVYILGPFVSQAFSEKRVRAVLIAHKLPASYIPSLQLYYSAFPLIIEQELVHTVRALIRVLHPSAKEFSFGHRITAEAERSSDPARYRARFDYRSVQKRYALENRFLRMIEEGDTEHVLSAFDSMSMSEMNERRYMNAIYSDPAVSMAMVRALSRKAAERGGAPLIEINEITQHAVQSAKGIGSEETILRNIHAMLLELTEAVKRHKLSEGNYSAPIRKAVSYLRLNYSQSVRLAELADVAGFAPSYLSRLFKEEVGSTVSAYLRKLRCEQAARLLKETDLPVSQISAYVGYPDHNYFVKAFRKQYQTTPGAWRESKRNALFRPSESGD